MHKYFIKTPWLVKRFFSSYVWSISTKEKNVYLTFDDGPHPVITPFVLDELKKYHAHATFFCIGKNVALYPDTYRRISDEGHAIGNHTQNHLNGWKVPTDEYLKNISAASEVIKSNLFRPPYGRIRNAQAKGLPAAMKQENIKVIMWDVLSADFDQTITPEQCLNNVLKHTTAGSIIVFHDSEKAFPNLKYALPETLKALNEQGYRFRSLC